MGFSGKFYSGFIAAKTNGSRALDKRAKDLGRFTKLKPSEFSGEHAVEAVWDHGHNHIEGRLNEDRRWQPSAMKDICFSMLYDNPIDICVNNFLK